MSWIREAISDNKTGLASSKRIIMLWGALIMGICCLMLCVASVSGVDVTVTFGTAATLLSGCGTGGYLVGKHIDRKAEARTNEPSE